jgi:hypothetical protein
MNESLGTSNRLKNAVKNAAVPEGLEARIRSRIHAEQLQSGVNQRLKGAVDSEETSPFLEARIRNQIRSGSQRRRWAFRFVPVAAAALAFAGITIAYQLGHLRLTVHSQESYIASVSMQVATLMRVGLGDHLHCAIFRKYPKNAPKVEEFVAKMDPRYAGLIPIVRSRVPETYRMMMAHECSYHRRKFVHLALKNDSNTLSVVIARKSEGESFQTESMLPALVQSGIPMYQAGVQRFQMTAFETSSHLVYFISDLAQQQNTNLMLALSPDMKTFLSKIEL